MFFGTMCLVGMSVFTQIGKSKTQSSKDYIFYILVRRKLTNSTTTSTTTLMTTPTIITTAQTTNSTTTTIKQNLESVLVLHNKKDAHVTNSNGDLIKLNWNNQGAVISDSYCSLTFKNQFYVFG